MSEHKGSKRCILELISSNDFIKTINSKIQETGAVINTSDTWRPIGLTDPREAELKDFLSHNFNPLLGNEIINWWLAEIRPTSTTPNWDMVSTCTINNQKGLVLVEAKAHYDELNNESIGKRFNEKSSLLNHEKIGVVISETNISINQVIPGLSISRDRCYQLSNRIAYVWWLANHGIPVVLIYLGFLNANDMDYGNRRIFETIADWENCFFEHIRKVGADHILDQWVNCGESSFKIIQRSI